MLAGEPVYSSAPILQFDQPTPDAEIHRRLAVSGWAVAPAGVKSIVVSIANGRVVVPATRVRRDDIRRAYPWYVHDPQPGFEVVLPRRPKGVQKNVSMRITLTDTTGRIVHSESRYITWH